MRETTVTFLYLGYLPHVPGTWASAGAIGLAGGAFLITRAFGDGSELGYHTLLSGGVVIAMIFGIVLGPWAVRRFDSHDPRPFVLDEVAGQWLSLIGLPVITVERLVVIGVIQFVLFRAFDIVKPTPARQLERCPHGWGIMADDLAVAAYVNLIGQVAFRVVWPPMVVA